MKLLYYIIYFMLTFIIYLFLVYLLFNLHTCVPLHRASEN